MKFCYNPKDLDPSYKMDLDLWDCFERKKLCLVIEEIRYISKHFEEESYFLGNKRKCPSAMISQHHIQMAEHVFK